MEKVSGNQVSVRLPGFRRELADGGVVEVTDRKLVPMGSYRAYRQVRYTHPGNAKRLPIEVVFEVWNRIPVCVSVKVSANFEANMTVGGPDISALPKVLPNLDDLRDRVLGAVGLFEKNPHGGWVHTIRADSDARDTARVSRMPKSRAAGPGLLKEVAEVHKAAPARGKVAAVEAAFVVSNSTAKRYIRDARKADLL